jgi:hypothetical protein
MPCDHEKKAKNSSKSSFNQLKRLQKVKIRTNKKSQTRKKLIAQNVRLSSLKKFPWASVQRCPLRERLCLVKLSRKDANDRRREIWLTMTSMTLRSGQDKNNNLSKKKRSEPLNPRNMSSSKG